MNRELKVDQVLDSWFAEGPTELPDRAVAAIAEQLDHVRRRGRFGLPWTFEKTRSLPALGGAIVIVAIAMVLAMSVGPSVRPAPSPTPSAPTATPTSLPSSADGWSTIILDAAPRNSSIARIVASPRGLVAVATTDTGSSVALFSRDGQEWSTIDGPAAGGEYVALAASDRGFLGINDSGAWTSEGGLAWRHVAGNWSGNPDTGGSIVTNATAGGPGYVAVGNHNSIWTSSDGSAWSRAQVPPVGADLITPEFPDLTVDIFEVGAVGEHLVATGRYFVENSEASGPGGQSLVLASTGGATWSTVLPGIGDRGVPRLGAGPGAFILIGGARDGEVGSMIWRSTDGVAWDEVGTFDFGAGSNDEISVNGIAATHRGYIAVGVRRACFNCQRQPVLWTSQDGRSWSQRADGEPFALDEPGAALSSVAPFGSRFLVGGRYHSQPAIWISDSDGPS